MIQDKEGCSILQVRCVERGIVGSEQSGSGKWGMASGEWLVVSGEWLVVNGVGCYLKRWSRLMAAFTY